MRCRDGTNGKCQEQKQNLTQYYQQSPVLSEKDFYPPQDNRYWQSGVDDIQGGDNFAEYTEECFKISEEEEWW